jgi:parallel beta-helix repeat protein
MKGQYMKRSAWFGVAAAAAFSLAPQAHATPWCPSAATNVISCSNCSRELTCDVNAFGLVITGNNVVLDGMGRSIYWSPQNSIEVTGIGTRIKNIKIFGAGDNAIRFISATSSATASYVENVYINSSNTDGIENRSPQTLNIYNSQIYYGGRDGVYSDRIGKTNVINSTIYGAGRMGLFTYDGVGSLISGNTITNAWYGGILATYSSGLLIENNTLNSNAIVGLWLDNASGTFRYNRGSGNGHWDCLDQHQAGVSVVGYGNNFPIRVGTGCSP